MESYTILLGMILRFTCCLRASSVLLVTASGAAVFGCTALFSHLWTGLRCFQVWAVTSKAAVNVYLQGFVWSGVFDFYSTCELLSGNHQADLQSLCAVFPAAAHGAQLLCLLPERRLLASSPTGCGQPPRGSRPPFLSGAGHLFMYLFAVHISSLVKSLFK